MFCLDTFLTNLLDFTNTIIPLALMASWAIGLRSFRYKVVSIQVDSTQIEVVSRHYRSRFDTCRKSIRFNSIVRSAAGEKAGYKNGILLTKMDICQWKLQFPSIVDHNKMMYCFFALPNTTNSFKISAYFSSK